MEITQNKLIIVLLRNEDDINRGNYKFNGGIISYKFCISAVHIIFISHMFHSFHLVKIWNQQIGLLLIYVSSWVGTGSRLQPKRKGNLFDSLLSPKTLLRVNTRLLQNSCYIITAMIISWSFKSLFYYYYNYYDNYRALSLGLFKTVRT